MTVQNEVGNTDIKVQLVGGKTAVYSKNSEKP